MEKCKETAASERDPCYFLEAPPEICNWIYELAVIEDEAIDIGEDPKRPGLTQTNRQISNEVKSLYFGKNEFIIHVDCEDYWYLLQWIEFMRIQGLEYLRRLTIVCCGNVLGFDDFEEPLYPMLESWHNLIYSLDIYEFEASQLRWSALATTEFEAAREDPEFLGQLMAHRYLFDAFVMDPLLDAFGLLNEDTLQGRKLEAAKLLPSKILATLSEPELEVTIASAKEFVNSVQSDQFCKGKPKWDKEFPKCFERKRGTLQAREKHAQSQVRLAQKALDHGHLEAELAQSELEERHEEAEAAELAWQRYQKEEAAIAESGYITLSVTTGAVEAMSAEMSRLEKVAKDRFIANLRKQYDESAMEQGHVEDFDDDDKVNSAPRPVVGGVQLGQLLPMIPTQGPPTPAVASTNWGDPTSDLFNLRRDRTLPPANSRSSEAKDLKLTTSPQSSFIASKSSQRREVFGLYAGQNSSPFAALKPNSTEAQRIGSGFSTASFQRS